MNEKTLDDFANDIRAEVAACAIGIDGTTPEGRKEVLMKTFDLFAGWNRSEALAYVKYLLEENPEIDLSPVAFAKRFTRTPLKAAVSGF